MSEHTDVPAPKTFFLHRKEDVSGVSGTGIVATGCQFSSGKCVLHWESETPTIEIFDSVEDLQTIHGHLGSTEVIWDK